MRRTIYLPEDLYAKVEDYLRSHPGLTFSMLVRQVLEERVKPKDLSPLLELAGIVKETTGRAPEQPEDRVARYFR
ncbi:MAG TPA: hypothetical protein VII06_20345 [Chloroflexota bacterium]|jgi:hypothetical protein